MQKHCSKRRFRDKAQAKKEKKKINQRNGYTMIKRVYWCGDCEAWHLTSQDEKRRVPILLQLIKKFRSKPA